MWATDLLCVCAKHLLDVPWPSLYMGLYFDFTTLLTWILLNLKESVNLFKFGDDQSPALYPVWMGCVARIQSHILLFNLSFVFLRTSTRTGRVKLTLDSGRICAFRIIHYSGFTSSYWTMNVEDLNWTFPHVLCKKYPNHVL